MFTEAIKKIDEKQKQASYCPVCTKRRLPKTPDQMMASKDEQQEVDDVTKPNQENERVSSAVIGQIPPRGSTEKKLEAWLRNSSTDGKPFIEVDAIDASEVQDGFTRLFSCVTVDYRMNVIRGLCGRVCVEYDTETGLASGFSEETNKWRFNWREKLVKAGRPIVITDEAIKERMVVTLCRELKTQNDNNQQLN